MNFYYPAIYPVLKIDQHIKKYAIKNNNIKHRYFVKTEKEQHFKIFAEIVDAVNNHGEGLEKIQFTTGKHKKSINFLTAAEITHLQDVAQVVSVFNYVSLCCLIMVFALLLWMHHLKFGLYNRKALFFTSLIFVITTIATTLAIGPLRIFRVFHELIFSQNQWFFYYQESLMTTLMKAPDIFAVISGLLFILGMGICCVFLLLIHKWFSVAK